jgi:hypothetical protein
MRSCNELLPPTHNKCRGFSQGPGFNKISNTLRNITFEGTADSQELLQIWTVPFFRVDYISQASLKLVLTSYTTFETCEDFTGLAENISHKHKKHKHKHFRCRYDPPITKCLDTPTPICTSIIVDNASAATLNKREYKHYFNISWIMFIDKWNFNFS